MKSVAIVVFGFLSISSFSQTVHKGYRFESCKFLENVKRFTVPFHCPGMGEGKSFPVRICEGKVQCRVEQLSSGKMGTLSPAIAFCVANKDKEGSCPTAVDCAASDDNMEVAEFKEEQLVSKASVETPNASSAAGGSQCCGVPDSNNHQNR